MNWRSPSLWIGTIAIALVFAYVLSDFARTAPGPLSAVHGQVAALQGFGSCNQCHGGWFRSMQQSCLKCHEAVAQQLHDQRGLHGQLGQERTASCELCHGEHHGEEFAVTNPQSFALAGVADVAQFDHALVGSDITGRHLQLACTACHLLAGRQPLPEGESRYLGLSRDCAGCHEDVHRGQMQLDCAACHGQDSFHLLQAEDHDKVLPLLGGHGGLSCNACHADGKGHDFDRVGGKAPPPPRLCRDCHQSPHRQAFVAASSRQLHLAEPRSCGGCHLPEHREFAAAGPLLTPAMHESSGFALAAPHDQAKCADCHAAAAPFAQRYPGRDADTCGSCHRDVHQGQFAASEVGRQGCLGCHDRLRFEPPAFGQQQHDRTAFPLQGRHRDVDCKRCHLRPDDSSPRQFRGTNQRCADCHEDVHAARFVAAMPGDTAVAEGCERCHTTAGFDRLPADGFDHARWTGFALRGAHAQSKCEACHPRSTEPDAQHRRFGRVADHFGAFTGCVTCHRDPHQQAFDRPGLPKRLDGRDSCLRCHVETSFRALDHGFDHERWTGFVLAGKHAAIDCETCHAPLLPAAEDGRTWARAAGTTCADCHQDPHAHQFETNGTTDCRRCHKTAERFADLAFRHDLDSRFPLGEPHRKLACTACHKPVRDGDVDVVRYRPIPFQCADCHGGQNDPLHRTRVRRP